MVLARRIEVLADFFWRIFERVRVSLKDIFSRRFRARCPLLSVPKTRMGGRTSRCYGDCQDVDRCGVEAAQVKDHKHCLALY